MNPYVIMRPARALRLAGRLREVEAAARRQLLDLVDHGRAPAWVCPVTGGALVVAGLAGLVVNLVGGGR